MWWTIWYNWWISTRKSANVIIVFGFFLRQNVNLFIAPGSAQCQRRKCALFYKMCICLLLNCRPSLYISRAEMDHTFSIMLQNTPNTYTGCCCSLLPNTISVTKNIFLNKFWGLWASWNRIILNLIVLNSSWNSLRAPHVLVLKHYSRVNTNRKGERNYTTSNFSRVKCLVKKISF